MSDTALRLDDFVCFAIYSANGAFNRAYKPLLDEIGLTYPQYVTMIALWEEDGRTVGQLGERLFLESNTLTPLLKRLEAAGLVRRERDRKDERQVRVRLTAEGRALKARAADIPAKLAAALGCGDAAAEVANVSAGVARLRDLLAKAA